jgi:hypothetical protein
MKTRKVFLELIVLVLVLNFFYEGIYKIAHWNEYSTWLHRAPLIRPFWVPLTYMIPIGEIALAGTLLVTSYRIKALYWIIILLIVYILWMGSIHVFSGQLFWPYHSLWKNPNWSEKVFISLGLSWISMIALVLSSEHFLFKKGHFHLSSNEKK